MKRFSEGTAAAVKLGPDVELSTLTYATAFSFNVASNCSPHSVDDVSVNSSASQLAKTIERFGRTPPRARAPSERARSIIDALPLDGIDAAVLPGVAVVSEDHLFVGPIRPADGADDGLDRADLVVGHHPQLHWRRARADFVGDAKPTLPRLRRLGAAHRLQQHARVARRQRRADDLRQRHGLVGEMRLAPGTEAHPGVSGSPGTMKSYGMPPDWMWLSLPQGPSG